ncbi:hypothetical protein ILYODFUR_037386 [Ilyodon furcidens]|uniref:Uncharacterized protein n=1 Tax=Ilyodon furcidens TaxID=33524 RepID=A0ABV0VKR4_9TELE
MLLQNLYAPFSITFTDVSVAHAMGTNTPPHHHRYWLLNFGLTTFQTVLFLFGPEDTMSMISKNNLKCGLVRSQHTSIQFNSIQFKDTLLIPEGKLEFQYNPSKHTS